MAENSKEKPIKIRTIGIYVIIILALLRFLILPLHTTLKEKKILLGERYENYRLKLKLVERQKEDQGTKTVVDKSVLLPYLYDKGHSYSFIQSSILEKVTKIAEQKGLGLINFEMLEPASGKGVSEVPILVRFKGEPKAFIETMESLEKDEKILNIRSMEITKSGPDQAFFLTISAFRLEI